MSRYSKDSSSRLHHSNDDNERSTERQELHVVLIGNHIPMPGVQKLE